MLTTFDLDEYAFGALRAGASAFLVKTATHQELVDAVRVVARGDAIVTPRITRQLIDAYTGRDQPVPGGQGLSAPQIVSATGVDPTLVHPLLGRLKKGQVIEQIGRVPGERTLLFRRIESPYWDLARRVAAEGPTASSPAA